VDLMEVGCRLDLG